MRFEVEGFEIDREEVLGMDIADVSTAEEKKKASECSAAGVVEEGAFAASVRTVREGGAMSQAGVRAGGLIVAIEGKAFRGLSFVEVLHALKECQILRPFRIEIAYPLVVDGGSSQEGEGHRSSESTSEDNDQSGEDNNCQSCDEDTTADDDSISH